MNADRERAEAAREVTGRAIRRLGLLETGLLLAAATVAALAGALTGWLLNDALQWSFRSTWLVSSLLYLAVPGLLVWMRDKREEAEHRARLDQERAERRDDEKHG